jgi:protein gp37
MGKQSETGISWTHFTFNPWMGCLKVSPACKFCYAESDRKMRGQLLWGPEAPRQVTSAAYWKQPLKWDREARESGVRARVFCGSLCDVMEDFDGELINGGCCSGLQDIREWLYDLIEKTPNLDWLLLTKRPQNYSRFLPKSWLEDLRPNVWGMTTVESSQYLWRVNELLDVPFAVWGLSLEPLLGPVVLPDRFLRLGKRAWVIVGGESGHGARPMHPDWARSLRDQCVAAGVPFHFKQHGEWSPRGPSSLGYVVIDGVPTKRLTDTGQDGHILGSTGGNDVWMQRVGKKAAGRILDGQAWDQIPEVSL